MRKGARPLGALALLLALAALTGTPASADWLVTRAGTRVETRGAWQVKGKLVVFHAPDGALSSLRLAEVDLDASGRATAEAERVRQAAGDAAAQAPKRKVPAVVLTDDDFRHVEPGAAGPASAGPASASAAVPGFKVTSWERSPDADGAGEGVVITGTLQNTSTVNATEIALSVQLLDAAGKPAATGQATLTSTALGPGQQSGFRVDFPGAATYSDVKFDFRALGPPVTPPEAADTEPKPAKESR